MKQTINLYQPQIQQGPALSGVRILLYSIAALLLVVCLWSWQSYQEKELAARLQSLQQEQQRLTTALEQAAAEHNRQPNPLLKTRLQELQIEKQRRLPLLNWLETHLNRPDSGFSPQLQALARQDLADTWLTHIHLLGDNSYIRLTGKTRHQQSIARYVQQLAEEPVWQGLLFSSLQIERDPEADAYLRFVLASRRGEDK